MVVDSIECDEHVDGQIVTYLEAPVYDGSFKYVNMEFISVELMNFKIAHSDEDCDENESDNREENESDNCEENEDDNDEKNEDDNDEKNEEDNDDEN